MVCCDGSGAPGQWVRERRIGTMGIKYLGPIKSKAHADHYANILDRDSSSAAKGAVQMLRQNWRYIAARPSVGQRIVDLARRVSE